MTESTPGCNNSFFPGSEMESAGGSFDGASTATGGFIFTSPRVPQLNASRLNSATSSGTEVTGDKGGAGAKGETVRLFSLIEVPEASNPSVTPALSFLRFLSRTPNFWLTSQRSSPILALYATDLFFFFFFFKK